MRHQNRYHKLCQTYQSYQPAPTLHISSAPVPTKLRMEAYKQLLTARDSKNHQDSQHKDKLLQTKLREKEVKAALKEQREEKKAEKEEERLEAAEAARFERAFHHNSKQYEADVRKKHKKEEHEKTGFMCEHGVWRCRICNPVTKHK